MKSHFFMVLFRSIVSIFEGEGGDSIIDQGTQRRSVRCFLWVLHQGVRCLSRILFSFVVVSCVHTLHILVSHLFILMSYSPTLQTAFFFFGYEKRYFALVAVFLVTTWEREDIATRRSRNACAAQIIWVTSLSALQALFEKFFVEVVSFCSLVSPYYKRWRDECRRYEKKKRK